LTTNLKRKDFDDIKFPAVDVGNTPNKIQCIKKTIIANVQLKRCWACWRFFI